VSISRVVPILIFFGSCLSAVAQVVPSLKVKSRITGTVVDKDANVPIEFANVVIIDPATSKAVDGTVCDTDGKFVLLLIPGAYKMSVSFVGYESTTIDLPVTQKKDKVDLGSIKLSMSPKILQEVTVEGKKLPIEEKIDRMVYNAENDQTTKGGDASDVLKRVPMLSVDIDGNVSLRGSTNVLVLINNKPSTITANSVADALKQIPADMIKTVEVITSPSSKYDAEGSAGIINIILKKNTLEGVFFAADATGGNRGSALNLSANYREGKMAFSLTASQRATYNLVSNFLNEQTTKVSGDTLSNIQRSNNIGNGVNSQYLFGWDYDINSKNKLSVTLRYGEQDQKQYQNDLFTQSFQAGDLQSSSLRQAKNTTTSNSVDASLTYTRLFAKKDRELNFLVIFSRNNPINGFVTDNYDPANSGFLNSYKNVNHGFTEDYSLQLDMKEPLTEKQFVEFGVKDIARNVNTQYQYFIAEAPGGDYVLTENKQLTNDFTYNQNIRSAYLSYTLAANNGYSFRVGSRYEYTTIRAAFRNESDFNVPSYGVLVPTLNLSRKLKDGRMIRLSYNRRIQRPSLRDLNPNLQASNPLNASMGNPNLKPEYTDNVEIAYNTFYKIATFNMSAFMRYNTNDIQPARSIRGDTIISVSQNIGTEANYGVTLFTSLNITDRFQVSGGADLFYRILKNNSNDPTINATNHGLTKNFRVSANYSLPKNWMIQFFSMFQGRNYNLQGYRTGVINHSLSVRKDVMRKHGSVGLTVDNFATPSFNVYSNLHSAYLDQRTTTDLHNFIFRVSLSYKLGKLKVSERKTGLNNEE
jgi:outer membrane receptor protein involved in Fe transport